MDFSVVSLLALIATIAILSITLIRPSRNLRSTKKPIHPPSPPALPVIGHLHLLKEPLHRRLVPLSHRYGPVFRLRVGSCSFLVVSSADAAEQCLGENDVVFANRPRLTPGKIAGYNFTTVGWAGYGELWRNLRRVMTVGALSSHRLLQSVRIRQEEVQCACRELLAGSGSRVDLNAAFFGITRNLMMRVVAGKRWAITGPYGDLFVVTSLLPTVCDLFPVLRWLGFGVIVEKKMRAAWLNRDRILQALLEEARNRMQCEGKTMSLMVDELVVLQKAEPEFYTDYILKGILVAMLTAGTDGTARTMKCAMSLLLNHQAAFDKARAEIDSCIGTSRLVKDSDLSDLPFLRSVVNETLRLFPVAPLLVPHYSSSDTTIAGYHVPKGTVLLVNAWALHNDPGVWEDPLAFKPERFLEGAGEGGFGFSYIPFGAGRRACPGSNLAMRTMMLAVAMLIQCFDFESMEGGVVDEMDAGGIVMTESQHLHAVCKPRSCMVDVLSLL